MLYLRLFWEFFKTGLFAIGGGLATLPFLQDMSDRTGWFTHAQLADMLAVSESTPGPIGVNMATYVGFTTGGVGGAVIATLGLGDAVRRRHPYRGGVPEGVPGQQVGQRRVLRLRPPPPRWWRRQASPWCSSRW